MPVYTFECPSCGAKLDVALSIKERDTQPILCMVYECIRKRSPARVSARHAARMKRVATAAAFTVGGFNAKNGYSR